MTYYAFNRRTGFTASGSLDEIMSYVAKDCKDVCGLYPDVVEPTYTHGDVHEFTLSSEDTRWVAVVFNFLPELSGYRFYEDP